MGKKQSDIEPINKYKGEPQKRLNNGYSAITFEAKQLPYTGISKALLIHLNSKTLKSYLKFLLRSYPNSIPSSDDISVIWVFKFLNATLS